MSKNFALIGAAGYIAPRHMKAIQETGHQLTVACDKFDSVGILDSYFPEASFFTEFERFDRHVNKLQHGDEAHRLHYMSICSPNYLHDAHIRFALRSHCDAICEKPLVLNPWNVDDLEVFEKESGCRVFNILQLRLHPTLIALKQKIDQAPRDKIHEVDLTYITSRGIWYQVSWKGDASKSGGVATNIGIHFFDMLGWLFGKVTQNIVHLSTPDTVAGYLQFERARVRWFLSISSQNIPENLRSQGKRTYRSIQIDGQEIEFSEGFTDLHTLSYRETLAGRGFGIKEARPSIETVFEVRQAKPIGLSGDYHPFCSKASHG